MVGPTKAIRKATRKAIRTAILRLGFGKRTVGFFQLMAPLPIRCRYQMVAVPELALVQQHCFDIAIVSELTSPCFLALSFCVRSGIGPNIGVHDISGFTVMSSQRLYHEAERQC